MNFEDVEQTASIAQDFERGNRALRVAVEQFRASVLDLMMMNFEG